MIKVKKLKTSLKGRKVSTNKNGSAGRQIENLVEQDGFIKTRTALARKQAAQIQTQTGAATGGAPTAGPPAVTSAAQATWYAPKTVFALFIKLPIPLH